MLFEKYDNMPILPTLSDKVGIEFEDKYIKEYSTGYN